MKKCYSETKNNIRSSIGDHNTWISIDEITDCGGRHVANVIVGILEIERPSQIFLIHSEALEKQTNAQMLNFSIMRYQFYGQLVFVTIRYYCYF